ncbi:MAG: hypothetical protein JKY37_02560, partial [Nannocystaceae bacterium]|nr:hypothetical protein [Nannocystaceae bacterium]
DIAAALLVIVGEQQRGDALRSTLENDEDLRDMISFATGERFVTARRALGFSVRPQLADGN